MMVIFAKLRVSKYQDFPLSFKLPACVGGQNNWSEVATDGASCPAHPAPTMVVFKNGIWLKMRRRVER